MLSCLRRKAGHEAITDGGADPYLGKGVVGVLVNRLKVHDIEMIEHGYERIDGEDNPQVLLGITLPFAAGIEVGQRTEQQHRQREARRAHGEVRQRRWEEDVAQQHRHAHRDGTPVVELAGGDADVVEIHPDHDQADDVKNIKHQFGSGLAEPEMINPIKHHSYRECAANGGDHNVSNLGILLESCLHIFVTCLRISRTKLSFIQLKHHGLSAGVLRSLLFIVGTHVLDKQVDKVFRDEGMTDGMARAVC